MRFTSSFHPRGSEATQTCMSLGGRLPSTMPARAMSRAPEHRAISIPVQIEDRRHGVIVVPAKTPSRWRPDEQRREARTLPTSPRVPARSECTAPRVWLPGTSHKSKHKRRVGASAGRQESESEATKRTHGKRLLPIDGWGGGGVDANSQRRNLTATANTPTAIGITSTHRQKA